MAFDPLAAGYDVEFTDRPVARWLRDRVHERLALHLTPGDAVLDLGCGTGEDARYMASLGAKVTATDTSPAMLDIARGKLADCPNCEVLPLDLTQLPAEGFTGPYKLVLANFGALNALEDLRPLAEWLVPRVQSAGIVCIAVMTRFSLWETVWQALHLRPRAAARRWSGQAPFGDRMTIYYPSVIEAVRAFLPEFQLTHKRGLAVFLPPSEMYGVVEKRPGLMRFLVGIDGWLWRHRGGTRIADHAWLELTRR